MELHRLDGLPISGLDNVDIQDIDMDGYDGEEIDFEELDVDDEDLDFSGLGYVKDPEIAYEILDEHGNVVMYADEDENLYVMDGLGELGFLKKIGRGLKKLNKFMKKKVIRPVGKGIKKAAKFTAQKVIKPVHRFVNRYLNPATILLRNGFLLAMKVNMMKVAERLRFGYLSDAEAKKRGVDPGGFAKLKKAISRAEKIYKTAGGKTSNLRKAILTGKGNRDKAVPLAGPELGIAGEPEIAPEHMDQFENFIAEADIEEIEELMNGYMEIDGLGAVATGSALAAASSAVAAVATILSKIGGVFDKAKKTKDDVARVIDTGKNLVSTAQSIVSPKKSTPRLPLRLPPPEPVRSIRPAAPVRTEPPKLPATIKSIAATTPAPARGETASAVSVTTGEAEKESWAKKNKVLLIGAGVLLAGGGVAYAIHKSGKNKAQKSKTLEGIPRDRKGKFKSTKKKPRKISKAKKAVIAPKVLL